jgi:NADH:ubiquinone oxidoreductase subunit 2 (subunit N)
MVSAAIAAFFYLRVAVTMFSPVGPAGDPLDGDEPDRGVAVHGGPVAGDGPSANEDAVSDLRVLTDAPPSAAVTDRGVVPVPALTAVALGLCTAFTVVFGIIPGPILDFAHQATLLFT